MAVWLSREFRSAGRVESLSGKAHIKIPVSGATFRGRADVRYSQREHQGVATVRLIATAAAVIALSGCAAIRPSGIGLEADHNSGLLVDGHDSRGLYREDSLDTIKAYLDWERPVSNRATFYVVAGAGYKYREGGFYTDGSPWVGNVRTGVRFSLDRH